MRLVGEEPLSIICFTAEDSWRDTREEKNYGKCAPFERVARKTAVCTDIQLSSRLKEAIVGSTL